MLLGIYLNEWKTYVYIEACTRMFIASLFIMPPTWKQLRCPSVGEWINCGISRQWNITQQLKRNELSSHEKAWRDLKLILLSERNWKGYILYNSNYKTFWKRQNYGDRDQWLPGVRGREGWSGRVQRIFRAVKLFCVILQWWIRVIKYLSKFIKYTTPRVNSNENYGCWVDNDVSM